MEYKLLPCESCENLISVIDSKAPTFVCPVCGVINERSRIKKCFGIMKATSPKLECQIDFTDENEGMMNIECMADEVKEALEVLRQAGWEIVFKGSKEI
jgi:predicted RNA-binding Zn-ribbon protein involved in translation (DUF1610 family)